MLCGCFLRGSMLFRSILVLLFLRFWLRLKITSRWVGSAFSCHWCCFSHRWFAVNSLCLSWFSRSGFCWSDFYALFHSSRMAPRFVDFILSLFISLFSHLVSPFIVDHVSCGSPFRHICYSRFGYCFSLCMLSTLIRLFMVSSLSFGFSVIGFHSPPLRLFIFFSCIPWYRCAELVFWSFGFFYSKFCCSSLAWAPCMCLFSLWGASYLLSGGCVSGDLDMHLLFRGDFILRMIILSLTRFFWFFALVLDRDPLCSRDCIVSYFIFLPFSDIYFSSQHILW